MNYVSRAFKKYADFNSRATRSEYWYFFLFSLIGLIVFGIIDILIGMLFLSRSFALIILMPGSALGVRRMHDIGRNGWFSLIPI